ncbi:MAG: hypothetical protein GF365_00315 [Candidatus Buchananbacteria bacterium]|nr:hypothetical protein [Candidatus Buchananbacteria bacterium]
MKHFMMLGMCVMMAVVAFGCSAIEKDTLFSSSEGAKENGEFQATDPAQVTEAPLPGATTSPESEPVAQQPAPPPASATSPVRLEGQGGGVIEIQAIPGSWGKAFKAFYITWFSDESQRFQKFQPLHTLKFNNVVPGEYYVNLQWTTKRWVVETVPTVEADHRALNGRVRIRMNGGPWHEFTSADTVKVQNPATGETYWNLRVVVP